MKRTKIQKQYSEIESYIKEFRRDRLYIVYFPEVVRERGTQCISTMLKITFRHWLLKYELKTIATNSYKWRNSSEVNSSKEKE